MFSLPLCIRLHRFNVKFKNIHIYMGMPKSPDWRRIHCLPPQRPYLTPLRKPWFSLCPSDSYCCYRKCHQQRAVKQRQHDLYATSSLETVTSISLRRCPYASDLHDDSSCPLHSSSILCRHNLGFMHVLPLNAPFTLPLCTSTGCRIANGVRHNSVIPCSDKKLIRRWDSECELSLWRHRKRTTKYYRKRLCVRTQVYQIQWNKAM